MSEKCIYSIILNCMEPIVQLHVVAMEPFLQLAMTITSFFVIVYTHTPKGVDSINK